MKSVQKKIKVKRNSQDMVLLCLFLGGIVFGTLFLNLFCSEGYEKFGVYSEYFIDRFSGVSVEKKDLFLYSFWRQSKEILLILLLSLTSLGYLTSELFLSYKGFSIGILVSVYVLQYGMGGVLLYGISIFPHYISYVLMILVLVYFSRELCRDSKEYRENKSYSFLKKKIPGYLRGLFQLLILNVITSGLETFVNLYLMKMVL